MIADGLMIPSPRQPLVTAAADTLADRSWWRYWQMLGQLLIAATGSAAFVTAGASYTMQSGDTDIFVDKTVGSPTSIVLLSTPTLLRTVSIKDLKGDAATNPITLVGPVDGAMNFVIQQNRAAITLKWSGSEWSVF